MSSPLAISSDTAGGPIFPLLLTVFTSIFQVFLLCLAGYILAWRGILDKRTIKQVNRLNIALFTPSLLFSKVALFLTPEKLKELWVIPIFFVVVTFVSMSVSFLLATIFRVTRAQRNFALAAAMFMNSNFSLVITIPTLKWGVDDNNNAMVGRALTYLLLYSTIGMVLRWSVGWHLLTQSDPQRPETDLEETTALVSHDIPLHDVSQEAKTSALSAYSWFPKSPNHSEEHLAFQSASTSAAASQQSQFESDDLTRRPELPLSIPRSNATGKGLNATLNRVFRAAVVLNGFMTAPLWAALASIIVACASPLQTRLSNAGNCSIPTTLVVLGAYFYTPSSEMTGTELDSGEKQTRGRRVVDSAPVAYPGETKTVVIAVVSRMILTPLILLPFMALCAKFDWQPVFNDSFLPLIAFPHYINSSQISQAASGDAFERLISRTIFWAYCIVTPLAMVAYAVIGLRLSKL
ncbi:auxin efflux carrier [Mycena olivaceomarginata]|nr:auxin efflux carrier [Mycena olivaceomarginata]